MKWFKENIVTKNPLTQKLLGKSATSAATAMKPAETKTISNANNITDTSTTSERLASSNPKQTKIACAPVIASPPSGDGTNATTPRKKQEMDLGTLWVIACGFEHAIFLVRHSLKNLLGLGLELELGAKNQKATGSFKHLVFTSLTRNINCFAGL